MEFTRVRETNIRQENIWTKSTL